VFQLGFLSLAVSASAHGVCSGYFARVGLTSKLFLRGLPAYCALLALVTAAKVALCVYALRAAPWTPPRAYAVAFEAADRAWLVLGLAVPFGKTLYCVVRDPSKVVWLSLSVGIQQSCQSKEQPLRPRGGRRGVGRGRAADGVCVRSDASAAAALVTAGGAPNYDQPGVEQSKPFNPD